MFQVQLQQLKAPFFSLGSGTPLQEACKQGHAPAGDFEVFQPHQGYSYGSHLYKHGPAAGEWHAQASASHESSGTRPRNGVRPVFTGY